VRFEGGVLSW
jgi:hypothetical protein